MYGATAAHSVTDKTSREDEHIWRHWSEFTASLGVPETLSSIQHVETRVCYVLVYAGRYREHGRRNQRVRTETVSRALRAVGQTIIKLGCPDPRMASPHSGKLHPLLRDYLAAIGKEDDPQDRSPPANVTILRAVAEALNLVLLIRMFSSIAFSMSPLTGFFFSQNQ